jgi:hypothetical protein
MLSTRTMLETWGKKCPTRRPHEASPESRPTQDERRIMWNFENFKYPTKKLYLDQFKG